MRGFVLLAALVVVAPPALAQSVAKPQQFGVCGSCHSVTKDGPAGIGPNLWGLAGHKAGTGKFAFSPAMQASKIVWNHDTLTAYIMAPKQVIPGSMMPYAGQKDPAAAAAIADYLLSLK